MTNEEFTPLAGRYMDMVYRVALNCVKVPADADDVTQNVMLRLCRTVTPFENEEHAKHWLIRVTVNESKRFLTAPWRSRTVALEQLTQQLPAQAEEQRELFQAVMALPVKYRLPLYLYYYEGYSVAEIGDILERKPSTVQTHLARGRERLKQALTEGEHNG